MPPIPPPFDTHSLEFHIRGQTKWKSWIILSWARLLYYVRLLFLKFEGFAIGGKPQIFRVLNQRSHNIPWVFCGDLGIVTEFFRCWAYLIFSWKSWVFSTSLSLKSIAWTPTGIVCRQRSIIRTIFSNVLVFFLPF